MNQDSKDFILICLMLFALAFTILSMAAYFYCQRNSCLYEITDTRFNINEARRFLENNQPPFPILK